MIGSFSQPLIFQSKIGLALPLSTFYIMKVGQHLKDALLEEFPGRTRQVETLLNWFGTPSERTPPSIFIHGNRALGKTELVKRLFTLGFPAELFSFINCQACYTSQQTFEYALKRLAKKRVTCKNINDFTVEVQRLCKDSSETRYLIFDNAELLWELSSTLVPALLTLPQWTGLNICVIFITQVPWEKFRKIIGMSEPWQLYFQEYTKDILITHLEVIQILTKNCPANEDPRFYRKFVENICDIFYENCDMFDFIRLLPELFDKFMKPVNEQRATRNDVSFLCNELKPYLDPIFDRLYMQNMSNTAVKPEEQLPKWSLYLLIATFLGSYIPQHLDQRYFAKSTDKKRSPRKKKTSGNITMKLASEKKGPQPCEMERVLAIFQSIYADRIISTFDIQMQMESFVTHRLLAHAAPLDRLESVTYRCNVSFNCVNQIARNIGFDISKYLDELY
ncbi:28_t:CDS:2 [Acaulospora morrowiae]|uniref:28_t:CDS:1 n=1 Tax=Acaulospora morrowiae TaxID=94023 RepID=A0A9N8ZHB8_9GLOM|nr:28_t:CDS:2 [Acaulospora morrowiae]